jgi:hypothetical protein
MSIPSINFGNLFFRIPPYYSTSYRYLSYNNMSSNLSLSKLLDENKNLSLSPLNKIVCQFTGHEMPPNATIVHQYIQSKRFLKAKGWYSQDYSMYLPHIVPHKFDKKKLYCNLTKISLNKIPEVSKYLYFMYFHVQYVI